MDNLKYGKQEYFSPVEKFDEFIAKSGDRISVKSAALTFDKYSSGLEIGYTTKGHGSGFFLNLQKRAIVKDGENFSFGFSLRRLDKLPGKGNKYPENNFYTRPYFDEIKALNVSSGIIADADQELILDKLIALMKADENNVESQFFKGKKVYYISVSNSTAGEINLTMDGTTTNFAATSNDAAGLVSKINGTSGTPYLALQLSDSVLLVTTLENHKAFTYADVANTTLEKRGIAVFATDPRTRVIMQVDNNVFEPEQFKLISFDWSVVNAATDSKMYFNFIDKASKVASQTTFSGNTSASTAVNTINTYDNLYATAVGDVVYIADEYGMPDSKELTSIEFSYTNVLEYGYNAIGLHPVYPANTGEELYRLFVGQTKGMYGAVIPSPDINTEYAILHFVTKGEAPHLTGSASGYENWKTRIDIIVPKKKLEAKLWNSTYDGSGNSKTLADLINSVFSSAVR